MTNFKKEPFSNYCTLSQHESYFTHLLNDKRTTCNNIKENTKQLDILQDGAILISGQNIVTKTFLISFHF